MAAASERNGSGQSLEDLLDNEGTTAGALVLTAFMTTATQPLTCVRLLMQVIGYKCQMTQLHLIVTLPAPTVQLSICVTSLSIHISILQNLLPSF